MSDQAFQRAAEATLDAVEAALERVADTAGLEVERQDNVITVSFDDDSKLIVNSHSSAREIWVAARAGAVITEADARISAAPNMRKGKTFVIIRVLHYPIIDLSCHAGTPRSRSRCAVTARTARRCAAVVCAV